MGRKEESERYSLRGRVYHTLRDDILSGKYKDHEELREMAISEELGVSRTPVREAFRQLELEGLLTVIPNKGAYVSGITVKDVADIYEMRGLLEGLCAKKATEHITSEQMEQLEEVIYLSRFHAMKGHTEQLTELDTRFHDVLYQACNSKMLEQQLRSFHEYVQRVRRWGLHDDHRRIICVDEHEKIMEAIREKDGDKAEALANLHMKNAYANMLKNGLEKVFEGNGEKNNG